MILKWLMMVCVLLKWRMMIQVRLLLDCIDDGQDPAVHKALLYAVSNTLVCDTLEEARRLQFADPSKRYKIVTLDGTLLARNGNITGGGVASDEQRGSSWDDRDYQRSKAERERLVKEREDLERGHRGADQLQAMRTNMSGLENRITNVKLDLKLSAEKLHKETTEQASIQGELAQKEAELAKVEQQGTKLAAKLAGIDKRIREQQEEIFADFSRRVGVAHVQEYVGKLARDNTFVI
jgi:structural maintenance of chromosome 1